MCYKGSTMVSTEIQGTELSDLHLAKTFYFVLIFHFKAKSKRFSGINLGALNYRLSTKNRINNIHYCATL